MNSATNRQCQACRSVCDADGWCALCLPPAPTSSTSIIPTAPVEHLEDRLLDLVGKARVRCLDGISDVRWGRHDVAMNDMRDAAQALEQVMRLLQGLQS